MNPVVLLQDVVDAMDVPNSDWTLYLNAKSGEIVTVTDEDRRLVESESDDSDDRPDWQRESVAKSREALESDDYLELPNQFEIHEWSIMERFAANRPSDAHRREFLGISYR